MPPISEPDDYEQFKNPGLFIIFNKDSGTVLDLADSRHGPKTKVVGNKYRKDVDSQKWQIADVGEKKYLLINQQTGTFLNAPSNTPEGPVQPLVGYPDRKTTHWIITLRDSVNRQHIHFYSEPYKGICLELKGGSEVDGTEVRSDRQNDETDGQKWLIKRVHS